MKIYFPFEKDFKVVIMLLYIPVNICLPYSVLPYERVVGCLSLSLPLYLSIFSHVSIFFVDLSISLSICVLLYLFIVFTFNISTTTCTKKSLAVYFLVLFRQSIHCMNVMLRIGMVKENNFKYI